jgi:tetratricopeptide (TPR) repeat protein
MNLGWFYSEVSQPQKSIEYLNQALTIAHTRKPLQPPSFAQNLFSIFSPRGRAYPYDPALFEGRAVSYLAWTYSSIGRYRAAERLYEQAIEIGAPRGQITQVNVWGLSTQELGALKWKMGDPAAGRKLIETALEKAYQYKVCEGISECRALLAELELESGEIERAEADANEALEVLSKGSTSVFNRANAMYLRAKVAARIAESDPSKLGHAVALADQAIGEAKRTGIRKIFAASTILRAELLPRTLNQARLKMLQSALSELEGIRSELRGTGSLALGRALALANEEELAAFYIGEGLKITEALLRKVDRAYALGASAELALLEGDESRYLQDLRRSFESASSTGNPQAQLAAGLELAEALIKDGFFALAHQTAFESLGALDKLLVPNAPEMVKTDLFQKRLRLTEIVADAEVRLGGSGKAS